MKSITGYYNGTAYVATESVSAMPNQKVIITFLDDAPEKKAKISMEQLESYCSDKTSSVPKGTDAQEYISELRQGLERNMIS